MHAIQQKLLTLAKNENLASLTLRKIGEKINEPGSPQKIKHHVDKLIEKGLLITSGDGKVLKLASSGLDDKSNLVSLPIVGSANCGEAMAFADQKVEGYLKVSLKILPEKYRQKIKDLFVLRAIGQSMNRARINGNNIEDGDYVIFEKDQFSPKNGEYVVSVIDGLANIKKITIDKENSRVVLESESSMEFPPIYIHADDFSNYLVCGRVVDVMKKPDELANIINASASDISKNLDPLTEKERNYYLNL